MCGIGLTTCSGIRCCAISYESGTCTNNNNNNNNNNNVSSSCASSYEEEEHGCTTGCQMLLAESSSSLSLSTLLRRRGPNASGRVSIPCLTSNDKTNGSSACFLHMVGHVLHLRGTAMTNQPATTIIRPNQRTYPENDDHDSMEEGGVLCWNGELYDYMREKDMDLLVQQQRTPPSSFGLQLNLQCCEMDMEQSDTDMVLQLFHQALTHHHHDDQENEENGGLQMTTCAILANVLSHCKGEYAFLYHFKGHVYYGRDPLGRRSLLTTTTTLPDNNNNNRVLISSVGLANQTNNHFQSGGSNITKHDPTMTTNTTNDKDDSYPFVDLPPGVVTKLSFETGTIVEEAPIRLTSSLLRMSKHHSAVVQPIATVEAAADLLLQVLDVAVRRRVTNIASTTTTTTTTITTSAGGVTTHVPAVAASVGVLFSGGLDSVVLAALAHRHVPMDEPIDLINVAFSSITISPEESPDRLAAVQSWVELQTRYPHRQWRLLAVDVTESELETHLPHIANLVYPSNTHMDINIGAALWFAARATGKIITASHNKTPPHMKGTESAATVIMTPNVCSMQKCKRKAVDGCLFQACQKCCTKYQKPICQCVGGAVRICTAHVVPSKPKNGANTNNKKAPTTNHMKNTDKKHVPRSYDLDPVEVTSTARVLLLGTGADEQMGGYGRHRKAYNDPPSGSTGAQHLAAELKLDFERLWVRNLGRDDRVISDHGKEARFPFLDEDVVHLLSCRDSDTNGNGSLPLDLICDMTLPPGVGDKRILRLVAQSLDVQICSSLVKRAIQFGSRIAKINGEREFGSKNRGYGTARHGCFSPPSN